MKTGPGMLNGVQALIEALKESGIDVDVGSPPPSNSGEHYSYVFELLEKQIEYMRKQNQELEDKMKAEKLKQQEKKD